MQKLSFLEIKWLEWKLGKTQDKLNLWQNLESDSHLHEEFLRIKVKLADGFPLDYLIGEVSFLGKKFVINQDVLIPRWETEWWVLEFQKYLLGQSSAFSFLPNLNLSKTSLLDIGCGSGVIGLSLASFVGQTLMSDNFTKALQVTRKNKNRLSPHTKNILIVKSDLLKAKKLVDTLNSNNPSILLANLPYVPEEEISESKDFKINYEPAKAIYSSQQGLGHFNSLLAQMKLLTKMPEIVIFELDPRNIQVAMDNLVLLGYNCRVIPDPNNLPRVLAGYLTS